MGPIANLTPRMQHVQFPISFKLEFTAADLERCIAFYESDLLPEVPVLR